VNIAGAIFDADGTLLDSMYVWETIAEDYLRSQGLEPHDDLTERFRAMSLPQAAAYYQREYGLALSAEAIMDGINARIARAYREAVREKPGAARLLERLRRQGTVMCVATATNRSLVETALSRLGLGHYFQEIWGCTELNMSKDQPEIFRFAQRQLGTAPEATWVFEDSPHAALSARAAGLKVAGVYEPTHAAFSGRMRQICDVYIRDLSEMAQLLDPPPPAGGNTV